MPIVIRAQYLIDAHNFTSREERRYYLRGPAIFAAPDGGVLIVATDGHRLGVFCDSTALFSWAPPAENPDGTTNPIPASGPHALVATVSKPDILKACKASKKDPNMPRWAVIFEDGRLAVVLAPEATIALERFEMGAVEYQTSGALIDGMFPDFRRIIPHFDYAPGSASPVHAYNATYLGAFGAVALNPKEPHLSIYSEDSSGPSLISVHGRDDFLGVIMPCRVDDSKARVFIPAWLGIPGAVTEPPPEDAPAT